MKNKNIEFQDLGLIEYLQAYQYQQELFQINLSQKQKKQKTYNTVLFCEHPHTYTLGKHGKIENLLINQQILKKINATFIKTDRGGDITYHGFGQLVLYTIFDLDNFSIGTKRFIEILQQIVIQLLNDYNIKASTLKNAPGVWLTNKKIPEKICAIGLKISNAITMHGIALNVNTDLNYFSFINPCGFTDKAVTSIKKELNKTIQLNEIKQKFKHYFKLQFNKY